MSFSYVCAQGFISGFALIIPWAMKSIVPTALVISVNFEAQSGRLIKEMPDYPVAAGITGTLHQEYILTYHCA